MENTINLDGVYEVRSESSYFGPFQVNADGMTEIKNGLTFRTDRHGCVWESSFIPLNEHEVRLESTVDPAEAPPDYQLLDNEGNPTRGIVVYESRLKLENINGKYRMSGIIKHGDVTTKLVMTQQWK